MAESLNPIPKTGAERDKLEKRILNSLSILARASHGQHRIADIQRQLEPIYDLECLSQVEQFSSAATANNDPERTLAPFSSMATLSEFFCRSLRPFE